MKLPKCVIVTLLMVLNATLFFCHLNQNYHLSPIDASNWTEYHNQQYLVESNTGIFVCSNANIMICTKNVRSYLASENINYNYFSSSFIITHTQIATGTTNYAINFKVLTAINIFILTVICTYAASVLLCELIEKPNIIRNLSFMCLALLLIFYSVMTYYLYIVAMLTSTGFQNGARLIGTHLNGIDTSYVQCYNNLDCFAKIESILGVANIYVIRIDNIVTYNTGINTNTIPIISPIINLLVIGYFIYEYRAKHKASYENISIE